MTEVAYILIFTFIKSVDTPRDTGNAARCNTHNLSQNMGLVKYVFRPYMSRF